MATTTYPVTGMTCEHCAQAVTGELSKLAGVSGCPSISFRTASPV